MKRMILAALLLASCGGNVQDVRIVDHRGRTTALLRVRGGSKDGPARLFWPDGTVRSEGLYRNDRREGWWIGYHDNGIIRSITHYVDGQKDGSRIYWDSIGRPMRSEVFARGVANGAFYRFFPDGRPAQHSNYVDGALEGPHHQWYDDRGGSHVEGYYVHGGQTGFWSEHDTLGRLIWQARLKDGEVVGTLIGKRRRH